MMMRVESSWFGGVLKVFQLSFSLSLSLCPAVVVVRARVFLLAFSRGFFSRLHFAQLLGHHEG